MTDASGTTGWKYDADSRIVRLETPSGVNEYGWDDASKLATRKESVGATQIAYDAFGRPQKLTNAFGEETAFGFDEADRLSRIVFANGVVQAFGYCEVLCRDIWVRPRNPLESLPRRFHPKVSFHVPIHAEPPDVELIVFS